MESHASTSVSRPIAVIVERVPLSNRWASERWEVKGVLPHSDALGTVPRIIVDTPESRQTLYPGLALTLKRDESEGYYLNLTSPEPKVFVLWRWIDETAQPQRATVSYGEGARWADSGEQVDGVPIPAELLPWIAQYVDANYVPEPAKKKRYASNKDRGRMGHVDMGPGHEHG